MHRHPPPFVSRQTPVPPQRTLSKERARARIIVTNQQVAEADAAARRRALRRKLQVVRRRRSQGVKKPSAVALQNPVWYHGDDCYDYDWWCLDRQQQRLQYMQDDALDGWNPFHCSMDIHNFLCGDNIICFMGDDDEGSDGPGNEDAFFHSAHAWAGLFG